MSDSVRSYEVKTCSLNWWQKQEADWAMRNGGRLIQHDQYNHPSYFTIDDQNGSRPFKFSSSFYECCHGTKC